MQTGSFAAAARRRGMPRSTVSLQVQSLETFMGVRLLKRSTRTLALTDEGRRLFDEVMPALATLDRAIEAARGAPGGLRGLIRITAPADLPTAPLAQAITRFTQEHPAVRIDVLLTNASLDLIANNIDIAVRVGQNGMEAIERPLFDVEWGFCAARSWIERNGMPGTVSEIAAFVGPPSRLRGYLERVVLGGTRLPSAAITADHHGMTRDLILSGFDVGLLPVGLCHDAIQAGTVQTLLRDAIQGRTRLALTFPTRADMLPRVRAFADQLQAAFSGADSQPRCQPPSTSITEPVT